MGFFYYTRKISLPISLPLFDGGEFWECLKKMITETKRRKTPEEEELDKKLADLDALESDLAQRELELATLHGGLGAFEIRYFRIIGTRYAELDEILSDINSK